MRGNRGIWTALLAAALVAGCTTAMDVGGIPHAGIQPDGSYVPTPEEQAGDCNTLKRNVELRIKAMRPLAEAAVAKSQAPPTSVAGVLSQMAGSRSAGNSAIAAYDREHARAMAVNKLMISKGCTPVDLASELANEQQLVEAARR